MSLLHEFFFNNVLQRLQALRVSRKISETAFVLVEKTIDEDFEVEEDPAITSQQRELLDLKIQLAKVYSELEELKAENALLRQQKFLPEEVSEEENEEESDRRY